MTRHDWDSLPAPVQAAVRHRCGEVQRAESPAAGRNSHFAATLHLRGGDKVFCKGSEVAGDEARAHRIEARVCRQLPAAAPRLLWQVEDAGWVLLGFEHVAGRHADLSPGSADLPLVADAVSALATDLNPSPVTGLPRLRDKVVRMSAWQRLDEDVPRKLDPWARRHLVELGGFEAAAPELIDGDALVHTDLHSLNILINDSAHVVDWAWAQLASAWVDAAYLVIRLIEAGHTPSQAEGWAATTAAWRDAKPEAVTGFAVSVFGMWEYLRHARPLPIREAATHAARDWARHRLRHA